VQAEKIEDTLKTLIDILTQPDVEQMKIIEDMFNNKSIKEILISINRDSLNYHLSEYIIGRFEISGLKYQNVVHQLVDGGLLRWLDKYICTNEGVACSADKTSFIKNRLIDSVVDGTNKTLKAYYEINSFPDREYGKKHVGELAFWSPVTLEDTDSVLSLYKEHLAVVAASVEFPTIFSALVSKVEKLKKDGEAK